MHSDSHTHTNRITSNAYAVNNWIFLYNHIGNLGLQTDCREKTSVLLNKKMKNNEREKIRYRLGVLKESQFPFSNVSDVLVIFS
jgi:hypothetical protein